MVTESKKYFWDCSVITLLSLGCIIAHLNRDTHQRKGESMKITKLLRKVVKQDGKHSLNAKKIVKLKNSKEFSYLVDPTRA